MVGSRAGGELKQLRELMAVRAVYDVASAARGPDFSESARLKQVFTERLRWLVGVDGDACVGVRSGRVVALTVAVEAAVEARRWADRDRPGFLHWVNHMYSALASMQQLLGGSAEDEDVRELEELKALLLLIRDYAYELLTLREFEEKARKLSITLLAGWKPRLSRRGGKPA